MTSPTPDPKLFTVADADGAAILDVSRGLLSTLNHTGAFIWQRLRAGESTEEIVDGLVEVTGEEREIVMADVRAFLTVLESKHLLATAPEVDHA